MPAPCGGCNRGAPYEGGYDVARQCRYCWLYHNDPRYRALFDGLPQPPPPQPPAEVPHDEWPAWVKGLAKWKQEGEVGAGDTVHRLLTTLGAAWVWKTLVVRMLGDCKCEERRAALNAMYPYPSGG